MAGGCPEEAVGLMETALKLAPRSGRALISLGEARMALGHLEQGIEAWRAALLVRPNDTYLLSVLAHALLALARVPEAIALLRHALRLGPDACIHSQLLYALDHEAIDRMAIAREHVRWGQRHAPKRAAARLFPNGRGLGRRLRIGYVSGDFRQRAPACFFEPLLHEHDRREFEITCYDNGDTQDDAHLRMKASACRWRQVSGLTDPQLRGMIRCDGIDILVDLGGHTGTSRLGVFALKAAPVQVTYLGYPNTTGIEQMDYRLTDRVADPPGMTTALHTERLLRLPRCFIAYRPPDAEAPLAAAPFPADGRFVFGSFCRPCKLSGPTVKAWSAILRRTPDSRLLLHHQAIKPYAEIAARFIEREIRGQFATLGVDGRRVDFVGKLDLRRHFELYNRVDLCLDPFPYNGTTALCEGLWMGVPAVALAGNTHVSRVAASLLQAVGLNDFVCGTEEEYIAKAVKMSEHPERLSRLRAGMRERLSKSALMDGAGLARAIEHQYRLIWRRYCRSNADSA